MPVEYVRLRNPWEQKQSGSEPSVVHLSVRHRPLTHIHVLGPCLHSSLSHCPAARSRFLSRLFAPPLSSFASCSVPNVGTLLHDKKKPNSQTYPDEGNIVNHTQSTTKMHQN